MTYNLSKARAFVSDVKRMAEKRGLNVFVVTDGASGIVNNGSQAVKNARDAHVNWELENGLDPYEDWKEIER